MRPPAESQRPYAALAVLCIGFFLIMMDTTIVNVAIPTIERELPASLNQVVWVNSAYLLTFAVPLLLAGRLGDWFGRKPLFLIGMAVFTTASLWCGLASSPGMLIAARAVQGIGAAFMTPQTMAFITALFPPERRGTPIGIWGGVGAVAAAVAPVLGGVLVNVASWHWIFIVNVPIGAVGLVLGLRVLPRGRPGRSARTDVVGAALSGIGLLVVVFCIQNGQSVGWGRLFGSVAVAEALVVGVVLLVGFVLWQRFGRTDPLMPLALYGHRNFSIGCVVVAATGFALTGMYLPLTLLLQNGLHLSPSASGLLIMPQAVLAGVVGPFAGSLSDRMSPRWLIVVGVSLFAGGIAVIALTAGAGPWSVVAGVVLCGIGTGAVFSPLVNVATLEIPLPLMGSASGVYNTARQVGSLLGSAAIGAFLQAQTATQPVLSQAIRVTLLLPVGVLVLVLIAAFGLRDRRAVTEPDLVPTGAE